MRRASQPLRPAHGCPRALLCGPVLRGPGSGRSGATRRHLARELDRPDPARRRPSQPQPAGPDRAAARSPAAAADLRQPRASSRRRSCDGDRPHAAASCGCSGTATASLAISTAWAGPPRTSSRRSSSTRRRAGRRSSTRPRSGYERLEAGQTAVGRRGRTRARRWRTAAEAHAGCLSFELSSGAQRIVVNCGAARGTNERDAPRRALDGGALDRDRRRRPRAGASSCARVSARALARRLARAPVRSALMRGPREVPVERREAADAGSDIQILRASHDGYRRASAWSHERVWRLSGTASASKARMRSRLSGPRPVRSPVAVRFHLAPGRQGKPCRRAETRSSSSCRTARPGSSRRRGRACARGEHLLLGERRARGAPSRSCCRSTPVRRTARCSGASSASPRGGERAREPHRREPSPRRRSL